MFGSRRRLPAVVVLLLTPLVGCNSDLGGDAEPAPSSVSVPDPAEEVALTAPVRRVVGPHAVELGDPPTLVIVVDGVPSSLPPGVEVRATGSVRVFREELGTELGIPLDQEGMEQLEGIECLVVARLEILDSA